MKVLITGCISYKEEDIQKLENLGAEIIFVKDERKEIELDVTEIEYVICNGLFLYNDIRKFKKLKYIQVTSAGLDRLPMEYIKQNNIKVFNARGVYSVPIAEWTILKILEIYKKSKIFYYNQKNRKWEKNRNLLELIGKTATILGYGSIGHEIAKRLYAFGVKINVVDVREKQSDYIEKCYHIDNLKEALLNSDINILCLPLTEETKGVINKETINYIKNGSVLINISRGEIIKEIDLIKALDSNKFLGVALDVFEKEPLDNDNKLWNYENVIITPHNSFVSENNYNRLFELILKNYEENKYKYDRI